MPSPGTPDDRLARLILWVSLAAGAALRLWLTFTDDGLYWPDEIFQTLEPAHRLVFGYGLISWEFVDGIRNWTLPGILAGVLAICRWVGLDEPRSYLTVIRLIFVACSLGCGIATYLLARTYGAGKLAAAVGAAVVLLFAPSIYFSTRALSETAAALPVALGFALAVSPSAGRRRTIVGTALVGLAVMFRLQTAPFALLLLGILLVRRSYGRAGDAAATFACCAFLYGVIDRLTWADAPNVYLGGWFHSAFAYVNFSLIEGKASIWGTSPWSYYFVTLFHLAPFLAVVALGVAVWGLRSAMSLWLATLCFVAAHAAIPHKELRFIVPALPFMAALVALGLDRFPARWGRAAAAVLLVAVTISAATFRTLTFVGLGADPAQGHSAYEYGGSRNRLFLKAREQRLLCGLAISGSPLVWSGGHTWLHRRVPLYAFRQDHVDERRVNYLIGPAEESLPGVVVARDGDWVLRDLEIFPCTRAPYSWQW